VLQPVSAAAAPALVALSEAPEPEVSRLRPNIPQLLEDVAKSLGGSDSPSQLLRKKRSSLAAMAAEASAAQAVSSSSLFGNCCRTRCDWKLRAA